MRSLVVAKKIAIAGATGAVGRLVRQLLEQRDFPYETITFLASKRSAGSTIQFKGEDHTVQWLEPDAFDNIDLVIGSTPDEVAAEFVPWAIERGTIVVDESGYHRMLSHVPLVVPEVNPEAIENHQGIIASPNCSTTQMVVAMKPLHEVSKIKRVIVFKLTRQPAEQGWQARRTWSEGLAMHWMKKRGTIKRSPTPSRST